jgi:hypothetical protein
VLRDGRLHWEGFEENALNREERLKLLRRN